MFSLRILTTCLLICFCASRSISKPKYNDRRISRPYIYAVSKSPETVWRLDGNDGKIISPLTARRSKGNFTLDDREMFCKVPETGVYAIYLQVNVLNISPNSTAVHSIAVGKVSDTSVQPLIAAQKFLPSSFTGSALCTNVTTLTKDDLLFVKLDFPVKVAWQGKGLPIQLVSYMVSSDVKSYYS